MTMNMIAYSRHKRTTVGLRDYLRAYAKYYFDLVSSTYPGRESGSLSFSKVVS